LKNPNNPKQRRLFYHTIAAEEFFHGEMHPTTGMNYLATIYNFTILKAVPQSMYDGWEMWVECEEGEDIPEWLDSVRWTEIN